MKIGVIVPLAGPGEPRYNDARAYALQAESAGFDAVWFFDHLLFRYPGRETEGVWESWTFLSAIAEATSRVELGTIVLCTPFRNPALLAKMAVTLDEVSGGRFILGLGAGWHEPEFEAFGMPFDSRVTRLEESLQIIRPLLKEGHVTFEGTHYQAIDCEILPRGPRSGAQPIMIAAFGQRMLRLTARYADLWNTAWLGNASELAERRAELEAACEAEGRDPATLAITAGIGIDLSPSDEWGNGLAGQRALTGSAEEVAAGLRGFAEAGVEHAICTLTPRTPDALERLGEALAIYRTGN